MTFDHKHAKTMHISLPPDYLDQANAKQKPGGPPTKRLLRPSVKKRKTVVSRRSDDYNRLLQSIYDAVLIADFKGVIIDFNSRAVDFLLCGEGNFDDFNVIDFILGADDSLFSAIMRNLRNERYTFVECTCIRRDKSTFSAEIAVNQIHLEEKGQLCFLVRDISLRKEAEEQLKAYDEMKSQFVSNVSHELKTPLTSMVYALSNMLNGAVGPLNERATHYLEILDGSCNRLLNTVNDILDLRKIGTNTLFLAKGKVQFASILSRCIKLFRIQAEQKLLTMNISIDKDKCFVECDVQKMQRVMTNVIGNAIKFTPQGGVLDIATYHDPKKPKYVSLTVDDTGIGIPAESISKVADRYFRADNQASGSGLGLAIAKEIVQRHEGSIEIESPVPGKDGGTRVSIRLSVIDAPRLLVVSGDKSVSGDFQKQTESYGYRVLTAASAKEAFDGINKGNLDLVAIDLHLPDMSGMEMMTTMRGDDHMRMIPTIMLVDADLDNAKTKMLNSLVSVVSKPWKEDKLFRSIETALLPKRKIDA